MWHFILVAFKILFVFGFRNFDYNVSQCRPLLITLFSEPFPRHVQSLPNFSLYSVVFECANLYCVAPKRKREKLGEGGGCWPFKSPGSHLSERGRDTQQWGKMQRLPTSLSAPLWLQAAISNQSWTLIFRVPVLFCPLALQALCKLL